MSWSWYKSALEGKPLRWHKLMVSQGQAWCPKTSTDQIVTWAVNYLQHCLVYWAYKDNCRNIPSGIRVTNLSRIGATRSKEWQAQGMPNQSSCNIELNSSNLEFCKIQAWGNTSHKNILCHISMLVVPTFQAPSIFLNTKLIFHLHLSRSLKVLSCYLCLFTRKCWFGSTRHTSIGI